MRRQWKVYLLALSFVLGLTSTAPAKKHHFRTFTTIDYPDAITTIAKDINCRGDIVGLYTDASGTDHGFLLTEGSFTTIDFPDAILTNAFGINCAGDIAGTYRNADGVAHGFLLSSGEFTTTLDFPGATRTRVKGINALGEVTGDYCEAIPVMPGCLFDSIGNVHGYLLGEGEFMSIDPPESSYTEAWRSNAAGEIVGRYKSEDGHSHVFLRQTDGEFTTIDFPGAIETAFGRWSDEGGINERGDIVGNYCDAAPCPLTLADFRSGQVHGFLRAPERRGENDDIEFETLDFPGSLGTGAFGINDHRDIVGGYMDVNRIIHGFLLSKGVKTNGKRQ